LPVSPHSTPHASLPLRLVLVLAAISALLVVLCLPNFAVGQLAWIALVPLFWAVARAPNGQAGFWAGFLFGTVFLAATCPWIYYTVHRYGELPAAVAGLVFVLFLGLLALSFGLFGWLAARVAEGAPLRVVLFPVLWVALEVLRAVAPFGGFPWNLLGYSQLMHPTVLRLAPIVGVFGISFCIALSNALLTLVLLTLLGGRRDRTPWWIAGAGLSALLVLPWTLPALSSSALTAPAWSAVLVQPDTSLDTEWTATSLSGLIRDMTRLSERAVTLHPQGEHLIVWPEQPAPLAFEQQPQTQAAVTALAAATHSYILLGETPTVPGDTSAEPRPLNAALLVGPDGRALGRYDKMHLVPFGEYVPLPSWLKQAGAVGKITRDVGDFVPGTALRTFRAAGQTFSSVICFESIFPALARREVAMGAQWLVNISDDGWYGPSSAKEQGLGMARMRAIENDRWLLRDTNDGLTAVIAPDGTVTARLTPGVPGVLLAEFSPRNTRTFYSRHGDWLADTCAILSLILGLFFVGRALAATRVRRSRP